MTARFLRIFVALLALSAVGSVLPLQRAWADDCAQVILDTKAALANVAIGGNNAAQTRNSLESKLDDAVTKLSQAKPCDALKKLGEFKDKVLDLAVPNAKGETKMAPSDAQMLAAMAQSAMDCINAAAPNCP